MVGKRFTLLTLAVAASLPCALHASSCEATFAPRSFVIETTPLKKLFRPNEVTTLHSCDLSRRGGASDSSNQIVSAGAFLAIDYAVRKVFQANDITFPSQLGGCIILFCFLLACDLVKGGLGNDILAFLTPGSALLAKWMPAFFLPGLAMLPRAPPLGSGLDILKILTVVAVGFFYSLTTTVFAVSFVGKGKSPEAPSVKATKKGGKGKSPEAPSVKATKKVAKGGAAAALPYSPETLNILVMSSIVMGAVSFAATRADSDYQTPLQSVFFVLSTLAAFVYSARLPSNFTKVVHPLVTSCAMVLGLVYLVAELTGSTFMNVLATYRVGSMHWKSTGAGDILLYLLGPSVVSFAVSMYSRKKLLKDNLAVVLTSMLVSSVGGAFGTAVFVRLLQIGGRGGGKLVRLSLIARNVTTALAMAITSVLGGDISIAASVVVLSGILGATYGRSILDAMGVKDPIARGLGIGGSAQGLGVASLVSEPDAFPFAAISMVLTAVCSTTLVSIPAVKDELIRIATGA